MVKQCLFLIFFLVSGQFAFTQLLFDQGICKCGVTAGGFSTGQGAGDGDVKLHIEPFSSIKKAYLFTYTLSNPPNVPIIINGDSFLFPLGNSTMTVNHANQYASPVNLYYYDITNYLNLNLTDSFNITIPLQLGLPINEGYWTTFVYIVYENPILNLTNYNILINDKDLVGNEIYSIQNLNPINTNFPVGFSLYTDRMGSSPFLNEPSHKIYFNNNLLGIVGGSDDINITHSGGSVKGHFYYQNNQLFGLDDDTPDAFMDSTDGLADVSSYLTNFATSLNFGLRHINYPDQPVSHNSINLAYFLTYSTPCDPISATVSSDTAICPGETVQLHASGGTKYEWQSILSKNPNNPAPGLSCTDCPNPVFSGDSSQVYTVRIWNGDSCSVVRPVRVTVVHPQPIQADVQATLCGTQSGYIKINAPLDPMYTFHVIIPSGDTLSDAISETYLNLAAGDYTVFYTDTYGCSNDTTVTIETNNTTEADFLIQPDNGSAPLDVLVENNSISATHYLWTNNGELTGNHPITHFDSSGTYEIGLIAWRFDPACADTTWKTVIVYDSLTATLPNVFTPNSDGVNDYFNVEVNLPVQYQLSILNRWGNVVFEQQGTIDKGTHNLWDGHLQNGQKSTDGTYFYMISFELDRNGNNCETKDCVVQKEGFVQVYAK